MRPVNLNRLMALVAPERVADGAGGFVETETQLGELWAEVRALTGRNVAQNGASLSQQRYRITVRAAPEGSPDRPRADQYLVEGNRRFLIHAVAEGDALGRYLTCFAVEEVAL
ncbi:head-tail adaptor protein [Epibacterium sp. SM1979]|uniref:Head-tail adaptor protein n=1 Tax=Tritonibacter litoralis TaxID=2662264 RepID=A0A843Y726_9RHOB|nr:head-tail adaptor protein [Tritonibacter litoralis]MQQ06950.1 head-tail adaptor protein [Tritonibacter litoralis]